MLLLLALVVGLLALPYTLWWLYKSGDVGVERAVEAQSSGQFVVFGSGVSQDFVDYKLQLYAKVKPEIAAVGSSRVMQFRGAYFRKPFLNVGGTAGNLPFAAAFSLVPILIIAIYLTIAKRLGAFDAL